MGRPDHACSLLPLFSFWVGEVNHAAVHWMCCTRHPEDLACQTVILAMKAGHRVVLACSFGLCFLSGHLGPQNST